MKKFSLIIIFLTALLFAQKIHETLEYQVNLIRFYRNEQEYENVINYADSAMSEQIMLDSLHYFKAIALFEQENWEKSADNFGRAMLYNQNEDFLIKTTKSYKEVLNKIPSLKAIEVNSKIIDDVDAEKPKLHNHFLKIMALLYEKNNLFEEANDVYKTILSSDIYAEPLWLEIKIAKNYIYQKEYSKAMHSLELVLATEDKNCVKDALFLYYLAAYSNENFEIAKETLIELYCKYPNHLQREEILFSLAKIFEGENQFLMSLFFFNELYKINDEAQKIKTYREIVRLKKLFIENSSIEEQFENFIPDFKKCEENISDEQIKNKILK